MPLATEIAPAQDTAGMLTSENEQSAMEPKTPDELVEIVSRFAATDGWLQQVRLSKDRRWYERVHRGADYDIWVIGWMPGQSTGFHDHGDSSGAFVVVTGVLEEQRFGENALAIYPGESRSFGSDLAHDVRNVSLGPAVSIHAYSPPLEEMNQYELDGSRLVQREHSSAQAKVSGTEHEEQNVRPAKHSKNVSIEQMLTAARVKLQRLRPDEACKAAVKAGAVLVDIRPEGQRALEGSIPGALLVERNVLEWRFDPASIARLPVATGHDLQVVVFCSEGYTSSLAAAALQELGLWRATDVVGGFKAWRSMGLPNIAPTERMDGSEVTPGERPLPT